jgi:hypothetical protein
MSLFGKKSIKPANCQLCGRWHRLGQNIIRSRSQIVWKASRSMWVRFFGLGRNTYLHVNRVRSPFLHRQVLL